MSVVIDISGAKPVSLAEQVKAPQPVRNKPLALALVLLVVIVLGLFVPSVVTSGYVMGLLTNIIILGVAAISVGFLAYQCGLMMFGAASITGGATYLFAVAVAQFQWNLGAAVVFGLFAATALSALIGALIVRTRPLPFAMLTLALGQMLREIVMITGMRPITGGDDGLALTFQGTFFGLTQTQLGRAETFWPVAWLALCGVMLLAWAVARSRFGQVLRATTANEERMRFSGFNTYWPRVVAFTVTGFIGAVSGLLTGLHSAFASPELLDFTTGGHALISMLLGGAGTVFGPLLGAFLFVLGQDQFGSSGYLELLTGLSVVLVISLFPKGAMGWVLSLFTKYRNRRATRKGGQHAAR